MLMVLSYCLFGALFLLMIRTLTTSKTPKVDHIPVIGSSGTFSAYRGAISFVKDATKMLQEGYDKYPGDMFRVPQINKWLVVVSGSKFVHEMRQAKDEDLSFMDAINERLQVEHTLGQAVAENPYHVGIIRSTLTRKFGYRFSDVRDELVSAFDDTIPIRGNEWVKVPALTAIQQIVSRTSNRLFVGLPLCRDPDYNKLNIEFTISAFKAALFINLFPDFMKPLVGRLVSTVPRGVRRAVKHLRPILEDRLRMDEQYGNDWPDRPNDLISWLLDSAEGQERSVESLTMRILTVNFSALHTTSMSFAQALYDLAAHPEYAQPLRKEVEAIIDQDGWTRASMDKMRKVDSFLKESLRMNGLGVVSMSRKLRRDYTFSNGTTLPSGTDVAVASFAIHHDEAYYPDPHEFQPFRFSDKTEAGEEGYKHLMVSTSSEHLTWGHGKHACPGRFFAVAELKAMLAHTLMTYDVKFENEGVRPPNQHVQVDTIPHQTAEVMFRKIQV